MIARMHIRRLLPVVLAVGQILSMEGAAPGAASGQASGSTTEAVKSTTSTSTNAPSRLRSSEDGWLDMSDFLDEAYGFVPLVILITEPAVGYSAAGGLAGSGFCIREFCGKAIIDPSS